jgi:hypothetical protein
MSRHAIPRLPSPGRNIGAETVLGCSSRKMLSVHSDWRRGSHRQSYLSRTAAPKIAAGLATCRIGELTPEQSISI